MRIRRKTEKAKNAMTSRKRGAGSNGSNGNDSPVTVRKAANIAPIAGRGLAKLGMAKVQSKAESKVGGTRKHNALCTRYMLPIRCSPHAPHSFYRAHMKPTHRVIILITNYTISHTQLSPPGGHGSWCVPSRALPKEVLLACPREFPSQGHAREEAAGMYHIL